MWFLLEYIDGNKLYQGFLVAKLKSSVRRFYGRQHDFVNRYGILVLQMTTHVFQLS